MDWASIGALGAFLAANFVTGLSGAVFTPGEWYENLRHPSWRPPNFLFPVVWTVLYVMMAVSGWLVWEASGTAATAALVVYAVQLALNFAWSAIFFGLHRPAWALAELAALWVSIVAVMVLFFPHSETASWLLAPYLAWVSFAGVLNYVMWKLNPDAHLRVAA
ncbi:MAG: TspO/MBR family protein [Pseudomonadota bacterium]